MSQNYDGSGYNTAVGHNAGTAVISGTENTLIGGLAGDALTSGQRNTALGTYALGADTTGQYSVAIGRGALMSQNFTGGQASYNVAVGYDAGNDITTGTMNTLVGSANRRYSYNWF